MPIAFFLVVVPQVMRLVALGLNPTVAYIPAAPKPDRVVTPVQPTQPKTGLTHIFVDPPTEEREEALIIINGDIKNGDDVKFREIAAKYSSAFVVLNSFGGTIVPAMDIGRTIKLREYTTVILDGSVCASACALIWLAGTRRAIYEGGQVGFHASYRNVDGTLIETGVGNALVGYYLSQLGMGQKAVIFATTAPPDKILWLNDETAGDSGIAYEKFPLPELAVKQKSTSTSENNPELDIDKEFCKEVENDVASTQSKLPLKVNEIANIIGVSAICRLKIMYVNYFIDADRESINKAWLSQNNTRVDQLFCADAGLLRAYRRGWRLTQNTTFRTGERITRDASCN